jgi:hypothetical protein
MSRGMTRGRDAAIVSVVIFVLAVLLFGGYDWLLGRTNTVFAYWDLLAKAFLEGQLFLDDPPTIKDLTFHGGHWYVPQPPLPALLMVPVALVARNRIVNPVLFSIFFSAVNCALVFVILDELAHLGWTKLSRGGVLWLVVLFGLGTPHLYVGMNGRVWFVTQVVTVTFGSLSILCALKRWSPWLVGVSLGAAVAARPNVFVLWVFLFAIMWQLRKEAGTRGESPHAATLVLASALPVALSAAGLLYYNDLRFGSFLDFGFVTINGSDRLVHDAQTYGLFSLHFVPRNLALMFLGWPHVRASPPYATGQGMSLFLATPALLFLVRRYRNEVWICGGWLAVFLSVALISMYHNTGASQFGFRYVLDFLVPLIMLLASTIDGVRWPRWPMKVVILASVVINVAGAWWFIGLRHF